MSWGIGGGWGGVGMDGVVGVVGGVGLSIAFIGIDLI